MNATMDMNIRLPLLRPDLEFHPGPRAGDGYPTFTIHDPLSGSYSKIGWAEAEILGRIRRPMTLGTLMADLARSSTLKVEPEEAADLCLSASRMGLTMDSAVRPVPELMQESAARAVHPLRKLLHSYLYFRIPLIRPENFLKRTLPLVRVFASTPALLLYLTLFAMGAYMALERAGQYLHTFTYFMNWQGLATYGAAVVLVKLIHEFAHAYTATAYGVRVPSMGVAFIVMWPVAFSHVTDAWTLPDRSKRLAIALAGIAAETVIAGLCLFGWAVTDPGPLNSVFFVTSSVTLISTFLVNLNPSMRYDGYYILMDLWGMDNLQSRAFAVFRHWYRTKLFGMVLPEPESDLPTGRRAGMIIYTVCTWVYRFFLYIGIALLVYHAFAKVLGIFLFGIEVWWFLLGPVIRESKSMWSERGYVERPFRLLITLLALGAVLAWAAVPMPRRFSVPAAAVPADVQVVYAPHSGVVQGLSAERGRMVKAGDVLLSIRSDELESRLREAAVERDILLKQQELLPLDIKSRAYLPQKMDEIAALDARAAGLAGMIEQGRIRAEIPGRLYEWDETLYNGRAVAKDEVLGRVADLTDFRVRAFVPEDRVADIAPGMHAEFRADAGADTGTGVLEGTVTAINPVNSATVDLPVLAPGRHPDLPVAEDGNGRMRIMDSRFMVEIKPDVRPDGTVSSSETAPLVRAGQGGRVWFETGPRSLIADLMDKAQRILLRESGF